MWRAGVARTIITPEQPFWLAGYGSARLSEGKRHDLWVKALALEDSRQNRAVVVTSDIDKALRAARTLDFGGVLVNEVPTFRADQQPYGGLRDSGNTREGPAWSVREMTEERLVILNG